MEKNTYFKEIEEIYLKIKPDIKKRLKELKIFGKMEVMRIYI